LEDSSFTLFKVGANVLFHDLIHVEVFDVIWGKRTKILSIRRSSQLFRDLVLAFYILKQYVPMEAIFKLSVRNLVFSERSLIFRGVMRFGLSLSKGKKEILLCHSSCIRSLCHLANNCYLTQHSFSKLFAK